MSQDAGATRATYDVKRVPLDLLHQGFAQLIGRGRVEPEVKEAIRQAALVPVPAAPPRTRAAVDAEIADKVRARLGKGDGPYNSAGLCQDLLPLVREPLAPDPAELGACPPDCPDCEYQREAAAEPEPDPCSCEESLALRARLRNIASLANTYAAGDARGALERIRKEAQA